MVLQLFVCQHPFAPPYKRERGGGSCIASSSVPSFASIALSDYRTQPPCADRKSQAREHARADDDLAVL